MKLPAVQHLHKDRDRPPNLALAQFILADGARFTDTQERLARETMHRD